MKSALHCLRHRLGIDDAQTQTTTAERELLTKYAAQATRILEIGVFEGRTTRTLAQAMGPRAELIGVDPFFAGRLGICWPKLIARREISKVKQKNVKLVEAFSADAARKLDGDFDLIFVDADHSLEGMQTDWNTWRGRCRRGGRIALHDVIVAAHNPYVADYGSHKFYKDVILADPDFALEESADSLAVVRKVN